VSGRTKGTGVEATVDVFFLADDVLFPEAGASGLSVLDFFCFGVAPALFAAVTGIKGTALWYYDKAQESTKKEDHLKTLQLTQVFVFSL
jgi:hypothetical protein